MFNQTGDISTLNGNSLKLVDKLTYLGNSVSSTKTDIDTRLAKAWNLTIAYRLYGTQTWPIKWNAVSSKQRSCWYCSMDALQGRWRNVRRKSLTATTQESWEQYWTSSGDNTPQRSSYTATYHPSRKLSKLDGPDMQDTVGELGTSSLVMYSYGPLHMAHQCQGDQLEPTYSSSVRIRGLALKTCRKRWTIGRGGERGSGISVLMAGKDDNDDDI